MFEDLRGKTALITGGSRGLGLAMATALASMGVRVALTDVLPAVQGSARELARSSGVEARGYETDVTDPQAVAETVRRAATDLGSADILVNSAGIAHLGAAIDVDLADWQRVMDINLTGTFVSCQAFARFCRDVGAPGTIVNVASMSGRIVNIPQEQAAYNTSKAGVEMLTKSLAIEWLPLGLRVNAIAPGYMKSDMTQQYISTEPAMGEFWRSRIPAGGLGEPEDLGGLVVYLSSSASRYVVGQTFLIDGGYTLV